MLKSSKKNVQKLVGLINYMSSSHAVLKSFAYNLNKTIGKADKPIWTDEASHSFKMIKKLVGSTLEKTHIQYKIKMHLVFVGGLWCSYFP